MICKKKLALDLQGHLVQLSAQQRHFKISTNQRENNLNLALVFKYRLRSIDKFRNLFYFFRKVIFAVCLVRIWQNR